MNPSIPVGTGRATWNKGKLVGQNPPLKLKEIWSIRTRLQLAERVRDLVLLNLVRIPDQSCHRFHGKAATHSSGKLPLIPANPATP
jgi:hypothetical protein